MIRKHYALVGHCRMASGLEEGVGVFAYDPETGEMAHLGDYGRSLRVGNQLYDPARGVLYAVDEFWSLEGQTGGGGRVASFVLNPETGALTQSSIQRTYAANPSYLAPDKTGKYLLVSHHCTDRFVTRMVKTGSGYATETLYDSCTLLLYEVLPDGSIGRLLDVAGFPGDDSGGAHRFSHLHCVVPDQEKNFFIVCDKGLDKIYSYRIDYERQNLVRCFELDGKPGSAPRYCNFHPTKLLFYSNCENCADVNVYALDRETGAFRLLGTCESVTGADAEGVLPSDIAVHPGGRYAYTSLREKNLISVLEISPDGGALQRVQTLSCGGVNPRGLCVSPDGRFLLCANMQSASVTRFRIMEDGRLAPAGCTETGGFPGNLQIVSVQAGGK